MDGMSSDVERVIGCFLWTDLETDEHGHVSVTELGRVIRQNGIYVSNFTILRIVSDGETRRLRLSRKKGEGDTKIGLPFLIAQYLDLWREHSRSKDESGEIPISELPNVVFSECNPTRELLGALMEVKSDGSESLNFEEFCEMLENLPRSGMIDEDALLKAFQTEDVDGSGYVSRTQLYQLLIENGSDPLSKEDVDDMMEDCGVGDRFKYTDWVKRVLTIKSMSEK
ncbi:CALM-like protein [Mya arenaria]|uniref:CALM-like protein n=1 Tax=Mya arenaria TaxID=6604 RepID=A0ABY7FQN1_MYAAR|nr:CALM-like protein [Mya arenaria]